MNTTKIALVTGGSRGLGRDMALSLARKGIDVILTYRSKEPEAREVANEIKNMGRKAVFLSLDMNNSVTTLDAFVQAIAIELKTGWERTTLDFVIHNAGMGATVPFEKVSEGLFDEFLNVHFKNIYF